MSSKLNSLATVLVAATLLATAVPSLAGNDDSATTPTSIAKHYLAIQVALAGDSLAEIPGHASALGKLATEAARKADSADDGTTAQQFKAMSNASTELAQAKNLADARAAFGELSEVLVDLNDVIADEDVRVAYCPMAKKHWLQATDVIANPYYGASMLRCGQFQDKELSATKADH